MGGASSASSPFFILEGGRAASDELRATAAEGGRQPGRLEREGGSSFFFLESFILILGSDFVPILGGLIIFLISLSPLLFSSLLLPSPLSLKKISFAVEAIPASALLPAPALLPMRGAQPALRSSSLPFSFLIASPLLYHLQLLLAAAAAAKNWTLHVGVALLCSLRLPDENFCAIAVLPFPGWSCFLGFSRVGRVCCCLFSLNLGNKIELLSLFADFGSIRMIRRCWVFLQKTELPKRKDVPFFDLEVTWAHQSSSLFLLY